MILLGFAFSACAPLPNTAGGQASEQASTQNETPCWLTHPAADGHAGAIGVTETPSLGIPAHHRARIRAVRQLTGVIGGEPELEKSVREQIRSIKGREAGVVNVRGESVYLRGFHDGFGRLYAYGTKGPTPPSEGLFRACPERARAEPAKCEPGWICSPVREGLAGFVGVSYRAQTAARQYGLAVENALKMIEYAYGVRVEGAERYLQRNNGVGTLRFRTRSFDVEETGDGIPGEVRAYVRELRYHDGRLYVWLVSPDLPSYPAPADRSWLNDPDQNGIPGAVGTAGRTADNFLSTQIQRAVDKGAYALAKRKGIRVDSEEQLKRSKMGEYYIRDVKTDVRTRIRIRVLGLYLDDHERVHVWVAPAS